MQYPDWIDTESFTEDKVGRNVFTKQTYTLSPIEATVYNCTMIHNYEAERADTPELKEFHYQFVRKGLTWFRQHNAEAYMVLLD